jgi:hypothetical protein
MRRPIGVTVAALIMGLLVVPELVWALFLLFSMTRAGIDFSGQRTGWLDWPNLAEMLAALALVGWSGATAGGLLHMSPWARRSAVWIGGVFLMIGISLNVQYLWESIHATVQQASTSVAAYLGFDLARSSSVWVSLSFLILGTWWLVYFRLTSVRFSFIEAALRPE